ncbi:S8 family serine peptidase [Synechococcus sp. RS9916]|uniref:S8 family serine peptidase n=1 Tax=Synechococcus sp. RS9916 TaxID=221359 RepID=UPI0000E534D4|nr:S8 family serine peptidase [Synechococcus sp. RS9916]EAU75241.1 subtilisin carlsberg precursor [Synechococcus sp. RS9916]
MNNLLELLTLRWLRPRSEHALDQASASPPAFDLAQGRANAGKQEHYVFFAGNDSDASLSSRSAKALKAAGITTTPSRSYDAINGFSILLTPEQAEALKQSPGIKSVEADRPMPFSPPVEVQPANGGSTLSPSPPQRHSAWLEHSRDPLNQAVRLEQVWVHQQSPLLNPGQSLRGPNAIELSALPIYNNGTANSGEVLPYGVKAVWGGEDVSARGNIGTGTYAFVIDSGVLNTTGDLNINTSWSKSWISGESAFTDGNGHGTHVAGTIAALANDKGVVGVAPGAEVISLKVFDSTGGGASYSTIIDAINHATHVINNNGLDKSKVVINMSLGGGYSAGLDQAVKNAANQGIKFAIAAGNSGDDADYYSPASAGDHENVYTVSAVDNVYQMPWWSNWDDQSGGDDVDVAAPGVGIYSYHQGGQLAYLSGTSMAAPHVAGLLLIGGIEEGEMVKAASSGQSDPFAHIKTDGAGSQPHRPGQKDHNYIYSFYGAAHKEKIITISNGKGSIKQNELEMKLGLTSGSLDSTLNGTKESIDAVEGSAILVQGLAGAGDTISFAYSFKSDDAPPYNDFAFYAVNNKAFTITSAGQHNSTESSKNGVFSHTLTEQDFNGSNSGDLSFSIGVLDALDALFNSTLEVSDFKIQWTTKDIDKDGLVDNRPYYQIYSNGQALTLKSSSGTTYSDSYSQSWDVIAAKAYGSGFKVLLDGDSSHENNFYIWDTNSDGIITNGSGWQSREKMMTLGYESFFQTDFNQDGITGITDIDNNGLVDNTSTYHIYNNGQALTLKSSSGTTYSDPYSQSWDVIAAKAYGSGFKVLLDGDSSHENNFYIWDTNSDGIITNGSGWQSREKMMTLGYESFFQTDFNQDGITGITDIDNNGLVDNTSTYHIYNNGQALTLKSSSGTTYSDSYSQSWDVIAAKAYGSGFKVLLDGDSSHENNFYIWDTNSDGIITNGSGWQSREKMMTLGYESFFQTDFNQDGITGITDIDNNGLVDNTSTYHIYNNGQALTLKSSSGTTYSDSYSQSWDVIAAKAYGSGFKVLLDGDSSHENNFYIWDTNSDGIITNGSGWQSREKMMTLGYESFFQTDFNQDGITGITDIDNNGLVDNTSTYHIYNNGQALTLKSSSGTTYSDSYSQSWDVIAAKAYGSGFKVLLDGDSSHENNFYIWDTNSDGIITNGSGWQSREKMMTLGYESFFQTDFNQDGITGITDIDNNGLVDNTSTYHIYNNGQALTLKSSSGTTYSDSYSQSWDVIAAKAYGSGFKVLLDGDSSHENNFYIWDTNSDGIITNGSGWQSREKMMTLGYESFFQTDFNQDKLIN